MDVAKPTCWHCEYSLVGFDVGQRCPECGNAITDLGPAPETCPEAFAAAICAGITVLMLLLTALSLRFTPLLIGEVFALLAVVFAMLSTLETEGVRFSRLSRSLGRISFWIGSLTLAPLIALILSGIVIVTLHELRLI